ncbi:MAG: ester cyclase [Actinomycetota bacterium]|nr:ester cyclase [Actinomycetota bacterium]
MGKKIRTLVDSVSAAWNRHDAPGFASLFSGDALLRIVATGHIMHGREQIREFAEDFLMAFPELRFDRRSTHDCSEAVCVIESTLTATHEGEFMGIPPTYRSVELLSCSIFTLGVDRLIGEETFYFDAATLLRQLGALPESANA